MRISMGGFEGSLYLKLQEDGIHSRVSKEMGSPAPWSGEERRLLVFNYKDIHLLPSYV